MTSVAFSRDRKRLSWEIYSGSPPGLWDEIRGRKAEILAHANALDQRGRIVTLAALIRGAPGRDATKQGAATSRGCDLSGVSSELKARLSAEDLEDIAAGDIPLGTVQQYEQAAIARETADLKGFFQEKTGILECAGLPRTDAELEAGRITATYARNRGYLWASLRETLAGHPVLLPQVPDRAGTVDSLTATVHTQKGRPVLRQGVFHGSPQVTTGEVP